MLHVIKEAITITAFIFVMMLLIEYINVLTQGDWQNRLQKHKWGQYVVAAALGALPGCLGPFAIVSMYAHRMISFGAVVATMIATSGDESFVMLAMVPKEGLMIMLALFVLGVFGGALTDILIGKKILFQNVICEGYTFHPDEQCECFPPWKKIKKQWQHCSVDRGALCILLITFLFMLVSGIMGPEKWNWIRITLLSLATLALFIVVSVPDHFLENHLWRHVVLQHVPRVFSWTCGILVLLFLITENFSLEGIIKENLWTVLVVASLVGLIPESGPHYVFVTLFAKDLIPVSILLASSIVQDGHGMLLMLAYSRKAFFGIKFINLLLGFLVGAGIMVLGF